MNSVVNQTPQSIIDSPNANLHPDSGSVLLMKVENNTVKNLYQHKSNELYLLVHELNTHKDSGLDLYCPETFTIEAGGMLLVDLGVKVAAYKITSDATVNRKFYHPSPYYLYARSSMPKTGLLLANSVGIIDSGYRGNLMARFYNTKDNDVTVESGTRLVQICLPNLETNFKLDIVSHLEETERGEAGLGSTGV